MKARAVPTKERGRARMRKDLLLLEEGKSERHKDKTQIE